jgi:transcriptional regulator with XRE-family HTH domain
MQGSAKDLSMTGRKLHAGQIRHMRTDKGWSQEHLAAVAGVTPRTVQRVEAGQRVSPETRMAIAAALEVSAESLTASSNLATTGNAAEAYEWARSSKSARKS